MTATMVDVTQMTPLYPGVPTSMVWVPVDSENGNAFSFTGREILFVHNPDTDPHDFTIYSVADNQVRTQDIVATIAAGHYSAFMLGTVGWRTDARTLAFSADDELVEVVVLRLP